MLKKVTIKEVRQNDNPKFVKTSLIVAEREGKEVFWEKIKFFNTVHIILNNIETEEVLLVKQVRIPVLAENPDSNGEVFEACAGLVDKDVPIAQIAKEEILEELGYDVPLKLIKRIRSFKSSVGTSGMTGTLYYAEVIEDMKVSEGGGLEEEDIEVVRIPYSEVQNFIYSDNFTDTTTLFLLMHFMYEQEL